MTSVTIKDDTEKCKVSLWRDLAASDIGIGQHIKILDVVVQTNTLRSLCLRHFEPSLK